MIIKVKTLVFCEKFISTERLTVYKQQKYNIEMFSARDKSVYAITSP